MDNKLRWNQVANQERATSGEAPARKQKQQIRKDRFCDTQEFAALRDEWYKKLAASGFEDIETPVPGNGDCWDTMKGLDGEKIRTWLSPDQARDRVLLYQRAGRFYWHLKEDRRAKLAAARRAVREAEKAAAAALEALNRDARIWDLFSNQQVPKKKIAKRLKVGTRIVARTLAKLKREFREPGWDAEEQAEETEE